MRREGSGRGCRTRGSAPAGLGRTADWCQVPSHRLKASLRNADEAHMDPQGGSWLCRSGIERRRVLDNSARVTRARTIASISVGATLLVFAPMFGWWTVVLFVLSAGNKQTVDRRMARSTRPELHEIGRASCRERV